MRKKRRKDKTSVQIEKILSHMEYDRLYNSLDFIEILDVKERRIQILLKNLAEKGYLEIRGTTKGRKYRKIK